MKKIFIIIMLFAVCVIGISATKDKEIKIPKIKAAKVKKTKLKATDKVYEGEYLRATNTFVYTKDNLVFPNKVMSYTVKDESGLLDGIYNFISEKYGVVDTDLIGLKLSGTVSKKDKVITIKKITNYQVPREKILGEEKAFGTDGNNVEGTGTDVTPSTNDTNTSTDTNTENKSNDGIFPSTPSNSGLNLNEGN